MRRRLLALHLARATPPGPDPRDPQKEAAIALGAVVVGVLIIVVLWGWLR